MLKNTALTYGSIAKLFHWIIALFVLVLFLVGYFRNYFAEASRDQVINLHKIGGITVLFLMLLRACWASMNPKPSLAADTPSWQRWIERLMHFSLYGTLIAMPLCGWIGAIAGGYIPHIWGWNLNLPVTQSKELDELCFSIHSTLAIIIIILVSIHVLAALYHHFIKKDNVLLRMLP